MNSSTWLRILLWPKIKDFVKTHGRDPNIASLDPLERRMADAVALEALEQIQAGDEKFGYLYVLQSLSAVPEIAGTKNLFKIGYTLECESVSVVTDMAPALWPLMHCNTGQPARTLASLPTCSCLTLRDAPTWHP